MHMNVFKATFWLCLLLHNHSNTTMNIPINQVFSTPPVVDLSVCNWDGEKDWNKATHTECLVYLRHEY